MGKQKAEDDLEFAPWRRMVSFGYKVEISKSEDTRTSGCCSIAYTK